MIPITELLPYVICAMALGVLTEGMAYALSLWWYRNAWMRIPNILLAFGLVCGGLAWGIPGLFAQFAAGAAFGLIYEVANDRWLRLWHFPGDPWTWLKGQPAVIGVGLSWGFVPPMVAWLMPVLA